MGVGIDCDTDEVEWGVKVEETKDEPGPQRRSSRHMRAQESVVDQPPLGKDVSAEDKKVRTGESALSRGTALFGWILKTVRHYNPLIHARPLPLLGDWTVQGLP